MHSSLLYTVLAVSSAAFAAPPTNDTRFHGVQMRVGYYLPPDDRLIHSPWDTVDLNKLSTAKPAPDPIVSLEIYDGIDVDYKTVECRAYKDTAGVVPAGPKFNWKHVAELGTKENQTLVGAILCYVVTEGESAAF